MSQGWYREFEPYHNSTSAEIAVMDISHREMDTVILKQNVHAVIFMSGHAKGGDIKCLVVSPLIVVKRK